MEVLLRKVKKFMFFFLSFCNLFPL